MDQFKVKKGPLIALVGILASVFGLYWAYNHGMLGPTSNGPSTVAEVGAVPDLAPAAEAVNVAKLPLPSTSPASVPGPEMRFLGMGWNSQLALALANGGPVTTQGSLMEKYKVNFKFVREDDVGKMQSMVIAFARAVKDGNPQPTEGAHFMAVMGDGSAATIAGMWDEMVKLGPEYQPEIIGSAGFSRGEDKFMGPPEWKKNPLLAKGALVAAYLRDGDWNIVLKWAADNNIKNNPDERTYDPEAINWYSVDDFIVAGNVYIEGVCDTRPVVKNGKRTGEKKEKCIDSVATWTPGDVNVAQKKGGLVSIVSTKEYRSQMPNTIIGVKAWNEANFEKVVDFLDAMYEAGDQVKAYPEALTRGAQASAAIYKEQDAAYWEKYFKGTVERDRQGIMVELGGSSVNNLQDVLRLYGIADGSPNIFAATYTVFGDVVKQQYPKLVPSYPPVEKVLNTKYTEAVAKRHANDTLAPADVPTFEPQQEMTQVVSTRNWAINFQTGKADFSGDSIQQLNELRDGLLIADRLKVEVHGHTDSTGNADTNRKLSQERAEAVKRWLMAQGTATFPENRFIKVEGHGSDAPIADNNTPDGRAQNRRVVVILGS